MESPLKTISMYEITEDGSVLKDGSVLYDLLEPGEAEVIIRAIEVVGKDNWNDIEDVVWMFKSYFLY